MDKLCLICQNVLNKRQKNFCSQSCNALHRNHNREKWTFEITDEIHQAIEGILLSDGAIDFAKTSNYPRFRLSQGQGHREYCEYFSQLFGLNGDRVFNRYKKYQNYQDKQLTYSLETLSSPIWTSYRNRWYLNGKKIIPCDFQVTPISMLHAYLGDGCLEKYIGNKNYGCQIYYKIRIHTLCFSIDDIVTKLINPLKKFDIEARYQLRSRDKKPILHIGKYDQIIKFLNFLPKNPVRCYDYKFACINN
jgi:hypothetical protein